MSFRTQCELTGVWPTTEQSRAAQAQTTNASAATAQQPTNQRRASQPAQHPSECGPPKGQASTTKSLSKQPQALSKQTRQQVLHHSPSSESRCGPSRRAQELASSCGGTCPPRNPIDQCGLGSRGVRLLLVLWSTWPATLHHLGPSPPYIDVHIYCICHSFSIT